jgi:hypothetical protein
MIIKVFKAFKGAIILFNFSLAMRSLAIDAANLFTLKINYDIGLVCLYLRDVITSKT